MNTEENPRDPSQFLRFALRGNAVFSGLSAVIFLLAAGKIAAFLGAATSRDIMILGAQLGIFSAWLTFLSTRTFIPRGQVLAVIALDVLWVLGSAVILLSPPATLAAGGKVAIAVVALAVADFAALQGWGLRRAFA